jgi:hypothetical protein
VLRLNVTEEGLLALVAEKSALRPLFLRRVHGLRWFDALEEAGYFDPKGLPQPSRSADNKYLTIRRWEIGDYLVKTASELTTQAGAAYVDRFLGVMSNATEFARAREFGNYQAWWQFSEALAEIPPDKVPASFLDSVDYWLGDRYERDLVAETLGINWLAKLLEARSDHASTLALRLIELLFSLTVVNPPEGESKRKKVALRLSARQSFAILDKSGLRIGQQLGHRSAQLFQATLERALEVGRHDHWSSIWQPAIEPHAQNEHRDEADNVLIRGLRDSLDGFMVADPIGATKFVEDLLDSKFQTLRRVAIYGVTRNFDLLSRYTDRIIDSAFLTSNYQHEMWHFLRTHYGKFEAVQRERVLASIAQLVQLDDNGKPADRATAYKRARWLAAVKDHGEVEREQYRAAVTICGTDPEHPDFSSYMSAGWVAPESPFTLAEISGLSTADLIATLSATANQEARSNLEGAAATFKELIKSTPTRFLDVVADFERLDLAFVHAMISAYAELWTAKVCLPWDDVWARLLKSCLRIVESANLWSATNAKERDAFVANRHWVVSSISDLIRAGAHSDDHAFESHHHEIAESILRKILAQQEGGEFSEDGDAVSKAINTPRGRCLEALINLTLRTCRLADSREDKQHEAAWRHFESLYQDELTGYKVGRFEFSVFATQYLPNFLYMSPEWVKRNLEQIFDPSNKLHWLCAMQGFAYVNNVYPDVYNFLKNQGHFAAGLDENLLRKKASDKIVQHIVVAYLNDFEQLEDDRSLIRLLLDRMDFDEVHQLIWFVWTLRKENDDKLARKVFRLWQMLSERMDLNTADGKKIASDLCSWAVYIDRIDEQTKPNLLLAARHVEQSHNSWELLRNLARLSDTQPFEANDVWTAMLQESVPDYPEEAIKQLLKNLLAQGPRGKRAAEETASIYLTHLYERPSQWLRELAGSEHMQPKS